MAKRRLRPNTSMDNSRRTRAPREAPSLWSAAEAGGEHNPYFMDSLARGLAVIRAFSEHRRRLTISQISQKTAISRAAVRRCLITLEQLGYVGAHDRTYSLRPQIMNLGYAYLASTPLPELAQPYLDRVSTVVHESCSVAILDGAEIVYIARAAVSRIMSINLRVGTRLPAWCTSMGRVLLSSLDEAALDKYLTGLRPVQFTSKTISSVTKLRDMLRRTRLEGFAVVDQELELGLRSIAVPVRDKEGHVVAAMNVGAQAARVSVRNLETQVRPHLQTASSDLGALLIGDTWV